MLRDDWDYTPLEHIRRMCRIADALLCMRRRGELNCVWLDHEVFHIRVDKHGPRERISWDDAEILTGLLRKQPSVESVIITDQEKTA